MQSSNPSLFQPKVAGFTLIELSIVLVIVGLVLGGTLVARHLIRVAEIRSTISQVDEIKTAIRVFKLKYNCLPGDCANIIAFGLDTQNGNGNGLIGYSTNCSDEHYQACYQLSRAGLLQGNLESSLSLPCAGGTKIIGKHYPRSKYSNATGFGFRTETMDHSIYLAEQNGAASGEVAFQMLNDASVKPDDAHSIDIKIDDGMPNTGKVSVARHGNSEPTCRALNNWNATTPYRSGDAYTCSLEFKNVY